MTKGQEESDDLRSANANLFDVHWSCHKPHTLLWQMAKRTKAFKELEVKTAELNLAWISKTHLQMWGFLILPRSDLSKSFVKKIRRTFTFLVARKLDLRLSQMQMEMPSSSWSRHGRRQNFNQERWNTQMLKQRNTGVLKGRITEWHIHKCKRKWQLKVEAGLGDSCSFNLFFGLPHSWNF